MVHGLELRVGIIVHAVVSSLIYLTVLHVVTKSDWVLGLELISFLLLGVHELSTIHVFLGAGHVWSLSSIPVVALDLITLLKEVQPDLIDGLALVESDLNSSITSGDTLEVVLGDVG